MTKAARKSVARPKAIETADDFVQKKVRPEFHGIVAMLRELMRKTAPRATELITYGILGWRGNRMLAVVSPTKKDITFAFSHGAELEDKYGLLEGVGKVSKHVKIKTLDDVDQTTLRYYVKQALKLDAAK